MSDWCKYWLRYSKSSIQDLAWVISPLLFWVYVGWLQKNISEADFRVIVPPTIPELVWETQSKPIMFQVWGNYPTPTPSPSPSPWSAAQLGAGNASPWAQGGYYAYISDLGELGNFLSPCVLPLYWVVLKLWIRGWAIPDRGYREQKPRDRGGWGILPCCKNKKSHAEGFHIPIAVVAGVIQVISILVPEKGFVDLGNKMA